jgi:hypothetical protein
MCSLINSLPTDMNPLNKTQLAKGIHRCGRHFAKLLATGALFLSMASVSHAQWMQDPTNHTWLAYQYMTGRVGIGTDPVAGSPAELLHVSGGNLRVDGDQIFNGNQTQTGLITLNGNASTLNFLNGGGFTTTLEVDPTQSANLTYSLPASGPIGTQVLSCTGTTMSWVSAGTIGGGGTINYIPRFTPSGVLIGNSVIQDQTSGGLGVIVGPIGGATPTTDLLQVMSNTRIGGVYAGPVLAGPTFGVPLIFGGVPGIFAPATTSENTDQIGIGRRNNAYDNSEVDLTIGDNPEGITDAFGGTTPDYFKIGATPTLGGFSGIFQTMFSFSTAQGLAIGRGVSNLNGLDVGSTGAMPGSTIPPSANVAIGKNYGGIVAAPVNGLVVQGLTGIGTPTPGNNLEVSNGLAAPNNLSGLRLTQFAGMTVVAAAPIQPYYLSINAAGDVIAALPPAGGGGIGPGTLNYEARWSPSTTTLASGVIYDDNSGNIGIGSIFSGSAIAHSNLSFRYSPTSTPVAQTVGVERTNVVSAPGTPLTITSGACLAGTTGNLVGGDLTLSSGIATGSGSSNIVFQVSPPGTAGATTDNAPLTKAYLAGTGKFGIGNYTSLTTPTTPTYDLSFSNSATKVIGVESFTTGSTTGRSLTVHAGGQTATGNHSGGDLILAGGVSNGTGSSHVQIQASTGSTLNTSIYVDGNTGYVGIDNGTTTPGAALDIGGGDLNVQNNAFVTGNLSVTGVASCTAMAWTSDVRLKTNIETLHDALSTVAKLRGTEYDFRSDEFPQQHLPKGRQYGFIAQELEQVTPELVMVRPNGYKAINYIGVIPIITEAVKEQQQEIVSRDSEIVTQNAMIADLTNRLSKLETIVSSLGNTSSGSSNQTGSLGVQFYQNNPNPFSDITTISFIIPSTVNKAELIVVGTGSNEEIMRLPIMARGAGSIEVNANSLTSGQYLYSIVADGQQAPAKKMTVLK